MRVDIKPVVWAVFKPNALHGYEYVKDQNIPDIPDPDSVLMLSRWELHHLTTKSKKPAIKFPFPIHIQATRLCR